MSRFTWLTLGRLHSSPVISIPITAIGVLITPGQELLDTSVEIVPHASSYQTYLIYTGLRGDEKGAGVFGGGDVGGGGGGDGVRVGVTHHDWGDDTSTIFLLGLPWIVDRFHSLDVDPCFVVPLADL